MKPQPLYLIKSNIPVFKAALRSDGRYYIWQFKNKTDAADPFGNDDESFFENYCDAYRYVRFQNYQKELEECEKIIDKFIYPVLTINGFKEIYDKLTEDEKDLVIKYYYDLEIAYKTCRNYADKKATQIYGIVNYLLNE